MEFSLVSASLLSQWEMDLTVQVKNFNKLTRVVASTKHGLCLQAGVFVLYNMWIL